MSHRSRPFLLGFALALGFFLGVATAANPSAPFRVFYVNSYHLGYGSSDDVMAGLRDHLAPHPIELRVAFLDAKREPTSDAIQRKAAEVLAAIHQFQPHLLIVSDDAAVQFLVVPHFREGPLPVVFCGVNNACDQYGLPTAFVTGMLEVVPIAPTLETVRASYPNATRLWTVSEDSTSERSNTRLLDPLYRRLGFSPEYRLVSDFEGWKAAFAEASRHADVIYLPTNGAVKNWDAAAATDWVSRHLTVPVVTCDDFMMPYAAYGCVKLAREQGEWAASTALAILAGTSPADIPVTQNTRTRRYRNPTLAPLLNWAPTADAFLPPR